MNLATFFFVFSLTLIEMLRHLDLPRVGILGVVVFVDGLDLLDQLGRVDLQRIQEVVDDLVAHVLVTGRSKLVHGLVISQPTS